MAFVAVKCNQCGANLEIDDSRTSGVCPYCKTAFVVDQAGRGRSLTVTGRLAVRAAMTPRTPIAAARPFSG